MEPYVEISTLNSISSHSKTRLFVAVNVNVQYIRPQPSLRGDRTCRRRIIRL